MKRGVGDMNQQARVLSESVGTQHREHISIQSAGSIFLESCPPVSQGKPFPHHPLHPMSYHPVCHTVGWMTVGEALLKPKSWRFIIRR